MGILLPQLLGAGITGLDHHIQLYLLFLTRVIPVNVIPEDELAQQMSLCPCVLLHLIGKQTFSYSVQCVFTPVNFYALPSLFLPFPLPPCIN